MSITAPKPLGLRSADGQKKLPAALLTTMSSRPSSRIVRSTAASTASGWRTSAASGRQRRPVAAAICSAAAARFSGLRLTIATSAPCRARASAIPRPIPVPPPVIRATLPENKDSRKMLMVGVTQGRSGFPA